jgi:preprotein translocase subunit YajC
MISFVLPLYAQAAAAAPAAGPSPLSSFVPLILIFVIFYFLLILPQQKRDKEHKKMVNALKKDDYVLTSAGIYGTIVSVKPDTVELKIDENTKIVILKTAINQVINPNKQESTEAPKLIK